MVAFFVQKKRQFDMEKCILNFMVQMQNDDAEVFNAFISSFQLFSHIII